MNGCITGYKINTKTALGLYMSFNKGLWPRAGLPSLTWEIRHRR